MTVTWAAIRVLGGVRLQGVDGPRPVGGPLAERLLGALVVAGGNGASINLLTEWLWQGNPPADPLPPLRMAVSRLRRRLATVELEGAIDGANGAYRLEVPRASIDAQRFVDLVAEARNRSAFDRDRSATLYEGALALWHGEPFGALAGESWATLPAAELVELRRSAEEELADLDLARHREAVAVSRLRRAVDEQPFRERRWVQLVTALYRLGRQADALRAVGDARAMLREELGIEPGRDLIEVERALLDQDPGLLRGPSLRVERDDDARSERLVGREEDVSAIVHLVRSNRVVSVHGLGGVGKSAIARVVAEALADEGTAVAIASLDGVDLPDEVCLVVADALGLAGADNPAELAAAAAGRGQRIGVLLVADGAERGAATLAEVADALGALAPAVKLLVTSRVPIGASGEVPYWLEPLPVRQVGGGPGPAVDLLLERTGMVPGVIDDLVLRQRVMDLCERTAGLPLAIELAAAGNDLGGLDGAALGTGPGSDRALPATLGPHAEAAVRDSVRWALDIVPTESRELLTVISALVDGLSVDAVGHVVGGSGGDGRRVLTPLLQTRLVRAAGVRAGSVRYDALGPIREVVVELTDQRERSAGEHRAIALLTAVAAAVGGPVQPRNLDAIPAVEAEVANVRHWVTRATETEEGLVLATAMAPTMEDLGLGAEGARWLDLHLAGARTSHPLSWARGLLASSGVRGFYSGLWVARDDLDAAAAIAADHGDWRLWLALQGRVVLALAWSGDQPGARAIMDGREASLRLKAEDDPWLEGQHELLRAIVGAQAGLVDEAGTAIRSVVALSARLDDQATALTALYLLSFGARIIGDLDESVAALKLARELCASGAARATQSLVAVELAHHARSAGEPGAIDALASAVEALERSGNLRAAAVGRRDLGLWRLADGDRDAMFDLCACVPTLLRQDRTAVAPALAELALGLPVVSGRRLAATAAALLQDQAVSPLSADAHQRVIEVADELGNGLPGGGGPDLAPLDDDEIIDLVQASRSLSGR